MASECAESFKTVEVVKSCPLDETNWNIRDQLKRCSDITNGTCNGGRELVYHCLPNAYRTESIEVCAPPTYIPKGICPEYSLKGKRINGAYDCSALPNFTCPTKQYFSTSIIDYQDCLKTNTSPDQSTTTNIGAIVGGLVSAVLIAIIIIIIIAVVIYRYKKSGERNPRIFISNEMRLLRSRANICTDVDNTGEELDVLEQGLVKKTRILLVGKTGTGKSSTGNSILQRKVFQEARSLSSVTNVCTKEEGVFKDINVAVIDTPGMFDTRKEVDRESYNEMKRLCHPGPHVVIIVFNAIGGADIKTLNRIKNKFGHKLMKNAIILFTHKDQLDRDDKNLDTFLSGSDPKTRKLHQFITKCNGRKIAFDNTLCGSTEADEQMDLLLQLIKAKLSSHNEYMTLK